MLLLLGDLRIGDLESREDRDILLWTGDCDLFFLGDLRIGGESDLCTGDGDLESVAGQGESDNDGSELVISTCYRMLQERYGNYFSSCSYFQKIDSYFVPLLVNLIFPFF